MIGIESSGGGAAEREIDGSLKRSIWVLQKRNKCFLYYSYTSFSVNSRFSIPMVFKGFTMRTGRNHPVSERGKLVSRERGIRCSVEMRQVLTRKCYADIFGETWVFCLENGPKHPKKQDRMNLGLLDRPPSPKPSNRGNEPGKGRAKRTRRIAEYPVPSMSPGIDS